MIRKWLEQRRKAQSLRMFNSGYDYAVGALIRGDETEMSLLSKADNPFNRNEYDRGIEAGVRDLANYVDEYMTNYRAD